MTFTDPPDRRSARELGNLLRARRERLQPADVGLASGARRRTPGLRREEVAQLASISATYYAFLEQGRDIRPSGQVLDALSRALRLSPAERAHVHTLAGGGTAPAQVAEALAPGVQELVARLQPDPAYVTGRRFDVLAANPAARLLWTDWAALPAPERNMLWWTFTEPAARGVLVEWETEASALLARYRAAAARHPGDPAFDELTDRLHHASPDVRAWWPRHDVASLGSGTKRLRHPTLGELELQHVVVQVAEDLEQKVVIFMAGERDRRRIAALSSPAP